MTERTVFLAALDFDDPSRRTHYVADVCGADADLRGRVESLLQAHDCAGGFLDEPAMAREEIASTPSDGLRHTLLEPAPDAGTVLGRYRLLHPLGEGGMGVVYLAEQQEPVRRQVALKLIKPGMDSKQIIARFEVERQALAVMDHPNIAKVLDGGTTPAGRPYFVMELVLGVPITTYCDEKCPTVPQRLELFIQVCQAVQHAHQKGIIHRDLKPSNVLVALRDGQPVPKVIDFGVAKALGQSLTEDTLLTRVGQVIGTLEYMAPEQAQQHTVDIDTRSDIYALGVLLYELLTGAPPFDGQRLRRAAYPEALRIIREEEPPRPSAALTQKRKAEGGRRKEQGIPRSAPRLPHWQELDWVVMRALEKDRTRRYATAHDLALDVERYLHDEPVAAAPPSARYKLGKFARKHQKPLAVTAGAAILLVAGAVFSTWLAWRALRAEKAARAAEAVMVEERDRAVAAERRAAEESVFAVTVNDFLNDRVLGLASPLLQADRDMAPNPQLTLREMLDRAAAEVEVERALAGQPRLETKIRLTIGRVYAHLGEYAKAQHHLEEALRLSRQGWSETDENVRFVMHTLARLYHDQARYAQAEALYLHLLAAYSRDLGAGHPEVQHVQNNLGTLYQEQGKYAEAEPLLTQILEARRQALGEAHADTLTSMNNLASLYQHRGEHAKAEPLFVRALEGRRKVLGAAHPRSLTSMNNLALGYYYQRQFAKAEPLQTEVLAGRRKLLGEAHPQTLKTLNNLALIYHHQKEYDRAEPLYLQALEGRRQALGADHPDTLNTQNNLADLYRVRRQYDRAEPILTQVLEGRRKALGASHPRTLDTAETLAAVYRAQKQYAKAEPLLLQCFEEWQRRAGEKTAGASQSLTDVVKQLVQLYSAWGKKDKADEWRQRLAASPVAR